MTIVNNAVQRLIATNEYIVMPSIADTGGNKLHSMFRNVSDNRPSRPRMNKKPEEII